VTTDPVTFQFPFQKVTDAKELEEYRPVVPIRPMRAPLDRSDWCLMDTGSPNTFLDWGLAPEAGADLNTAEKIPNPEAWAVGGEAVEALWGANVELIIPNGQHMIRLGYVPVVRQALAAPRFQGSPRYQRNEAGQASCRRWDRRRRTDRDPELACQ
jgi:hypothetical protein